MHGYKYDGLVKTAISKYFIEWVEEYLSRGDLEAARACYRSYLAGRPVNKYVSSGRMLSNAMRLYVPQMLSRALADGKSVLLNWTAAGVCQIQLEAGRRRAVWISSQTLSRLLFDLSRQNTSGSTKFHDKVYTESVSLTVE